MSTPFTLAALKLELQNDPAAVGYAGKPDNQCTALINAANSANPINRADITPAELLEVIDTRDFVTANATPPACSWFESVTQLRAIRLRNDNGTSTRTRQNLNRLLNDTNGSQTRFDALQVRDGSRAETLWGAGVVITDADIGAAKALP